MRSARSVRRPHTNHHGKNTRRNRGKLIKNARMRRKQWAHALIYSPEVTARKQTSNLINVPLMKDVCRDKLKSTDEEHAHRAEKKKEKRLLTKQNNDEIRRLEQERKENEREKRKLKREEEKKRKEEIEHQKQQEMKKREMKMQKEAAEKQARQKEAADEKAKKELEAINKEKENAMRVKKSSESEKTVTKEKPSSTDKRSAPHSSSEEEVEKKKQRKGTESIDEKGTSTKVTEVAISKTAQDLCGFEKGKHAKKREGKTKKTSESDSGFHNDDHETVVTNDIPHVDIDNINKPHGKHKEDHEKAKSKVCVDESTEIANGDMAHTSIKKLTCVNESAPLPEVPNGGSMVSKTEYKSQEIGSDPEGRYCNDFAEDETSHKRKEHMERNGEHEQTVVEGHTSLVISSKDSTKSQEVTSPVNGGNKSATPIIDDEMTAKIKDAEKTTSPTTTSTSPTQFSQNVEKLIAHVNTKMKHDEVDPNVKATVDAEQNLLPEKKSDVSVDHKVHINPLHLDHHISRPTTPSTRERLYKLLPKDIIFCSGLIDSHGENYTAMAADPRNIYKENARGIQRKIRIFKESPHYQTYLRAKNEGRPIEDILAEEGQT